MKQLTTLLILITSLTMVSQTLLFKSSFEDGVYLEEPFYDDITSGTWWQHLYGSDIDGFSWPINLWNGEGVFQVLIDADLPHADYIQNTLEIVDDENSNPTRVIHQNILNEAEGWTQDPYIVYTETEEGDLYVKYKIKFPENLTEILGSNGWLTFFEWKTSGDYRIAAYIYEDLENHIYWYVHGDNEANGGLPYEEFWYEEDHIVSVPEGEWFTTEFFWHRSTGSDGRFWWAINGNIVADYHGANKHLEPIDRIMLFTNYSSSNNLEQWVDDIEIWNNFPCGEGVPCYQTASINDEFMNTIKFDANPNPSNKNMTLHYNLSKESLIKIELYNVQSQLIKVLVDEYQNPGFKELIMDTTLVSNGIYFCKLSINGVNNKQQTIKLFVNN